MKTRTFLRNLIVTLPLFMSGCEGNRDNSHNGAAEANEYSGIIIGEARENGGYATASKYSLTIVSNSDTNKFYTFTCSGEDAVPLDSKFNLGDSVLITTDKNRGYSPAKVNFFQVRHLNEK